jgi:hypothetical protein
MADTSWVVSDFQSELYAKAQALGADTFTLSSEVRARTFVETKERFAPTGKFTFQCHFKLTIQLECIVRMLFVMFYHVISCSMTG